MKSASRLSILGVCLSLVGSSVSAYTYVPPMTLTLSSRVPKRGDTLNLTVDTMTGQGGLRVALFAAGGFLDPEDGSLVNPVLMGFGSTAGDGTYTYSFTVPSGFEGINFYVKAYAKGSGKLLSTPTQGLMVIPHDDDADWIVDDGGYLEVSSGNYTSSNDQVEAAYDASSQGDIIVIENGFSYKGGIGLEAACGDHTGPMTWLMARDPNATATPKPKILRHPVGGSGTIGFKNGSCNIALVGLDVEASDLYGISTNASTASNTGNPNLYFLEVEVDGLWDHYTSTGQNSKWGMLTWELGAQKSGGNWLPVGDFIWRGGGIRNIKNEHCFYHHSVHARRFVTEDTECQRSGRTGIQMVARATESAGLIGTGDVYIANNMFKDNALEGSQLNGGTTLTFAGRNDHDFVIHNNSCGLSQTAVNTWGTNVGTGCMVSHLGGGSQNIPNGNFHLQDNHFVFPEGFGDRNLVDIQLDSAQEYHLGRNNKLKSGYPTISSSPDALFIANIGSLALEQQNDVSPEIKILGQSYTAIAAAISALGCNPYCW